MWPFNALFVRREPPSPRARESLLTTFQQLQPHGRRRWRIAWLLGFGVLVNYFDRVNLSVSQDALNTAFGVSTVAFGVLASAYNWTYAACQLPIGVILDKLGVRRVGRIGTFLWSMASFAAALSPSIPFLFGARFLLGVGEAPTFPANAKAVGLWFPPHERGFSTAIFDAAAKFGPAVGVPLLGMVLLAIGWRWSFAVTGIVSLAYFVLFWVIYRDPQDDPKLTDAERTYIGAHHTSATCEAEQPSSFLSLVGQRKVIGLTIGFGGYNYVFYMLLTWLPGYLSMALHLDLLHSFLYTGAPWIIATATDLFIGGWLVDALIRRGWDASRVRRTVLIGGTACGLGILGAAHPHSPLQAIAWISLSIGGLAAAAPVGWSLPSLIARRADVGKVGGIMNFSNQVSGIAAPIVTGILISRYHSFALAFAVPAVYLLIGIFMYLFVLGRIEVPQPAPRS